MIKTEKIKFNGINKDVSPAAIDNGGNRIIVNPILDALNVRYLTSDHSDGFVGENIKGNTQVTNSLLPSGTNKCIGSYEDKQNNLLIYFIWNSLGNHSIFKYNPLNDTVSLIIQKQELNFQDNPLYLITGIGSVNNLLFFTDGYNPQRLINITRNYDYIGFTEADITLNKRQPITPPILFSGTNGSTNGHYHYRTQSSGAIINSITDKNVQFSYRYVYLDDELSVLSPYSILSRSEVWPDLSNVSKSNIMVRIPVSSTINQIVKKIEVLYRENNGGTWKVWRTITPTNGPTYYDLNFNGTEFVAEVAESESNKVSESIPNYSKSLCIQKNRLFISDEESGFNDTSNLAISPIVTSVMANPMETYFKSGSKYRVGIALWDSLGRSMGVIKSTEFNTPEYYHSTGLFSGSRADRESRAITYSTSTVTFGSGNKSFAVEPEFLQFIKNSKGTLTSKILTLRLASNSANYLKGNVVLVNESTNTITINVTSFSGSGSGALWVIMFFANYTHTSFGNTSSFEVASKVSVLLTGTVSLPKKASHYSIVVSDNLVYEDYFQCWVIPWFYRFDTDGGYAGTSFKMDEQRIYLEPLSAPTTLDNWRKIHLQLPTEMPIVLDNSWYVRILDGLKTSYMTSAKNKTERIQGIVGGDLAVVNTFGVTNWYDAITYSDPAVTRKLLVEFFKPKALTSKITYREVSERIAINTNGTLPQTAFDLLGDTYILFNKSTYNNHKLTDINGIDKVGVQSLISSNGHNIAQSPTPTFIKSGKIEFEKIHNQEPFAVNQWTMDYSKKSSSRGITLVEVEDNERVRVSKTKIRFSNKFIQDSSINGLNSFDSGSSHSIGGERGQLKKLVALSSNILAVHDRACTTLYVEEGIIRTADNQESLSITSNVIGHDRKLLYEYGSYHAESVQEIDGTVFGFDVHRGVVWRYTQEGLHPISLYGMAEYFRQKGLEYLPIKDTCKIIGGIDPFHREYILTFRKSDGTGETWVFNIDNNTWVCRASFVPEMYGRVGNYLFSFVNGVLWKHNSNALHNYFYGVQYNRVIKLAVNPYPSKKKVALSVQIAASEALSTNPDEKILKVYTPSGQESYTKFDEFQIREDTHYGPVLKDINTPSVEAGKIALRDGDQMRGEYIVVQLETSLSTRAQVRFLNLTWVTSEYSE